MAFPTASFWISLYIQRVLHKSAIMTAVYLLPMAIGGTIVNIIAGVTLHRISNKLLMGIAAVAYTISNLLYALNKPSYPYWAMIFLGQIFAVIGADLQFNVVNMYVMSSLSKDQQSVAGGLFQMVTRLCLTVGMGISTAIYDGVANHPAKSGFDAGTPEQPYSATFWFAMAASGLSVFFVPFLTIKTQGHAKKADVDEEKRIEIGIAGSAVEPGTVLVDEKKWDANA
jgi:MFS family permease